MSKRNTTVERKTSETNISLSLDIDGQGKSKIKTGLGFLDHMLASFSKHSGLDLELACTGDLQVDDHHTTEDCALVLGAAIDQVLGDRSSIARFGYAYAPMDEALARAVIDLSSRPCASVNLGLERQMIGELATENLSHFIRSLAMAGKCTIHVDVLKGENDHHRAEAAFKALALALKQALSKTALSGVPSTKGVLK